jgi:hypothetical protein
MSRLFLAPSFESGKQASGSETEQHRNEVRQAAAIDRTIGPSSTMCGRRWPHKCPNRSHSLALPMWSPARGSSSAPRDKLSPQIKLISGLP